MSKKYINVLGKTVHTFKDAEEIIFKEIGLKKVKYPGMSRAYRDQDTGELFTFFRRDTMNFCLHKFVQTKNIDDLLENIDDEIDLDNEE